MKKIISFLILIFTFTLINAQPLEAQQYECMWMEPPMPIPPEWQFCRLIEGSQCPEGYETGKCGHFEDEHECKGSHDCIPLSTRTPTPTIQPTPTGSYTCPICRPFGPGTNCSDYGLIPGSGTCPPNEICCQTQPTPTPTPGPGSDCDFSFFDGNQYVCPDSYYNTLCEHDPTICCNHNHLDQCPEPKHENCILNPNEPGPCPDDYPVMCAGTGYCCVNVIDCEPISGVVSSTNPFCSVDGIKDAGIETAIGCIPITSGNAFVEWLFPRLLGIMGGIAFLLMLYGGFLVLTSSGNPEKIKAGQETITAAITGLLFAIFSLFILQLIGVEILQIPGLQ